MTLTIRNLAQAMGRTWVIVVLGLAYVVSQIVILVTLEPVRAELLRLQCCVTSAAETREIFRVWQASGAMDAYRAHFILDDVHWVWYAGFFTAVLGRLFERRGVTHRLDWILVLPLASGLLDVFENQIQHVFLSTPDFSMVVNPLPLISTVASDLKWVLVVVYVGVIVVLMFGRGLQREPRRSG